MLRDEMLAVATMDEIIVTTSGAEVKMEELLEKLDSFKDSQDYKDIERSFAIIPAEGKLDMIKYLADGIMAKAELHKNDGLLVLPVDHFTEQGIELDEPIIVKNNIMRKLKGVKPFTETENVQISASLKVESAHGYEDDKFIKLILNDEFEHDIDREEYLALFPKKPMSVDYKGAFYYDKDHKTIITRFIKDGVNTFEISGVLPVSLKRYVEDESILAKLAKETKPVKTEKAPKAEKKTGRQKRGKSEEVAVDISAMEGNVEIQDIDFEGDSE